MIPLDEVQTQKRRALWLRLALALLPAIGFVALLWFGLTRTEMEAGAGDRAPDFELPAVGGGGTVASEDLRGKPVVVNFWASWCVPCREEAPILERAYRRYRREGVVILGVNIQDAQGDAEKFIEDHGITYPNVRDADQRLTREFGVNGLPETFFIDHTWTFVGTARGGEQGEQKGTVVLGAISEDELVANIETLLERAAR